MEMKSIVLTPYIGSASHETRLQMAMMAAENLFAILTGKHPQNLMKGEIFSSS
jgi:lactate dehydrogenase-like 2-hydroxyacid dehydrogenase